MKKLFTTILLLIVIQVMAFSQNRFRERIDNSDIVIEGKVIGQESFWNESKTQILTRNTVTVSKIFKGEIGDTQIDIVTKGGIIGDDFQIVTHTFQIENGKEGIFFLKQAKNLKNSDYWVRGIPNPFIPYSHTNSTFLAKDGWEIYTNPVKDLYVPIEAITRKPITSLQNNSLEESIEHWLNEVITVNSVTDILIEFSFDNIQFTGSNYVEFDIMAKTNDAGIKFAASDVFIEYSTEAFGTDVVSNEKIEATKETIIEDEVYTLQLTDETASIVKFLVSSGFEPNQLYPLSSFFEKFIHIKLEVENLWQLASLSFDGLLMANQSVFYNESTGEYIDFDKVGVSDSFFPLMMPNIESVQPSPTTAGTGSYITITGTQFGDRNADSKVFFRNANYYPGSNADEWVEVFGQDDIPEAGWSNEEITVLVPQVLQTDGTGGYGTAGSGNVRVENSFGDDISEMNIDVLYSITNIRYPDENFRNEYRIELRAQGNSTPSFGTTWRISETLANSNALVVPIIQDAVMQWRCATEIGWDVSTSLWPSGNAQNAVDFVNVIFSAPVSEFSNPQLIAETFITGEIERLGLCNSVNTVYVKDIDIAVKNTEGLFGYALGDNPILLDQKDFYSTILHELGHAHMLSHALPYGKVMYPNLLDGSTTERTLTVDDISGGQDVLSSSEANLGIANSCPPAMLRKPCGPNNVGEIDYLTNLLIFPNPTQGQITLSFSSEETIEGRFEIFNLIGQQLHQEHKQIVPGENRLDFDLNYLDIKGSLFIKVITEGSSNIFSFIKL
jgi:hypothetical protein